VLGTGDTFLDIGANHGTYSVVATKLVGPSGAIIAIEAIPKLARLLEKSLIANAVRNFEVHAVAAAEAPGIATFFVPTSGSGSSSIYASYWAGEKRRSIQVPLARLDDILAWPSYPGHMVMKLDVEGSELACLRGATRLIEAKRPVILLEINPTSARAAGQEPDAVLRHLAALGYDRVGEIARFPETVPIARVDCGEQRNVLVHPAPRRRLRGVATSGGEGALI
jgi:FkbM family methyltransferase